MKPGAPQDNIWFLTIGTVACLFIAFSSSLFLLRIVAVVLAGLGIVQLGRRVIAWHRAGGGNGGKK